jgi:hypothetical protein
MKTWIDGLDDDNYGEGCGNKDAATILQHAEVCGGLIAAEKRIEKRICVG